MQHSFRSYLDACLRGKAPCRKKRAGLRSRLREALPVIQLNLKRQLLSASFQVWILLVKYRKKEAIAAAHRIVGSLGKSFPSWKSWAARRKLLRSRLQQALALKACHLAAEVSQ